MNKVEIEESGFNRILTNRHIQMIGLGGAIGTGLFLGSAGVIKTSGPAMLLGYAISGLIAFLMMRQLGEMLVEEPVSGSLSFFANKYLSGFSGYLSGWNYAAMYILVAMAELTAIGKYIQYWWPQVSVWESMAICFIIVHTINLLNVRIFGETEFWFSIVKVLAVVAMIGVGLAMLLFWQVPGASISNLWSHGGFFPNGIHGLLLSLPVIMFSFGGLEMIGFAAGETQNPQKTIPGAINQVLYRIGIFYVGALTILLSLTPWDQLSAAISSGGDSYSASPFVRMFSIVGSESAANILNVVVLTAALSVFNSTVFCNSRQLFSLAKHGHAPGFMLKLNKNKVPVNALFITALITAVSVFINYFLPDGSMVLFMSLTVSTIIINWFLTSLTHLKFRKVKGKSLLFPSFLYPFTNYICMLFIVIIVSIMLLDSSMLISIILIPVWIIVLYILYRIKNRVIRNNIELTRLQ